MIGLVIKDRDFVQLFILASHNMCITHKII